MWEDTEAEVSVVGESVEWVGWMEKRVNGVEEIGKRNEDSVVFKERVDGGEEIRGVEVIGVKEDESEGAKVEVGVGVLLE